MNIKFFWIPARDGAIAETELNRFLVAHSIIQLEKVFVASESAPGWSLCVQWVPSSEASAMTQVGAKGKSTKIDYRELLDDETFRVFAVLRAWRKEKAAEQSVPVYTVATNEQLAQIARERIQSESGLEQVEGFGKSRIGKYGVELVELCRQMMSAPVESNS